MDSALNWATTFFYHFLSNTLFNNHPIVRRYTVQDTDGVMNEKKSFRITGLLQYKQI
jgi:hypothetical protein